MRQLPDTAPFHYQIVCKKKKKMKNFFLLFLISSFLFSCQKNTENGVKETISTDTLLQKNGIVVHFKKFPRPLITLKRDQTVYSENYQKRLYKIAEYYLANSQRDLVKYHLQNPDANIGFSMEENDWEEVNYTQIGIFNKVGSNLTTLQWLFYNPKTQQLFEYDLNLKKMTPFPLK